MEEYVIEKASTAFIISEWDHIIAYPSAVRKLIILY